MGGYVSIQISQAKKKSLEELSITYAAITDIPPEAQKLTCVRRFYLPYNRIVDLNHVVVPTLEQLILFSNELYQVPVNWSGLVNLKILDLSLNEIAEVGTQLTQLRNLEQLNLSHNPITNIHPEAFSGLNQLKEIKLINCMIKDLPICVWNLPHLQTLDASYNLIETVNKDISKSLFDHYSSTPKLNSAKISWKLYNTNSTSFPLQLKKVIPSKKPSINDS